ncbi:ACP S-malonyltransferase [Gulosibacter sp. ACHW.36C]|uniref:[acyl-carrier-protein] S-malonyltransferase n=1 Tax=Gulosibacter sediminis TaxID=1729695 RepID=A0ABY4N035_9MICO|nr:ACP S-malonyltransferase [Gulosibacter sediminis]UQN15999.1 ACP S-malonyltransferase [Gulosibacter sediminis]
MTIITFPGQGSQKPGFLSPWLATPERRDTLAQLSDAVGVDLVRHGTESDAETIRDTAIAQPLIVAAGILTWDALVASGADLSGVEVAGHSVGEIAAAYAAGVFDAATALAFVSRRATLMAEDAAKQTTGMSAVLGGAEDEVLARLAELELEPANFNGAGQIVAAGDPDALEQLRAEPAKGTRVIPLKVAGAFHTRYMADAHEQLAASASEFSVRDPKLGLYTNFDGSRVDSGSRYLELLIDQVHRPVHWDACMAAFIDAGHVTLVEAAPAGTLVGLAKRGMKGTTGIAVNVPEDIDAVVAALAEEDAA